MARPTGAWAAMAILLCFYAQATSAQGLRTGSITPYRPKKNSAVFVLNITVARGSPSCGPTRYVILVNGMFQPTLYANVKDTITVTINNNIPLSFPQTSKGVSLHWHGFSMWDEAAWADGTAYVTQCPIQAGTSYTYSFLADESPGTYLWHDHNTMNRANGLQGAIVLGYPVLAEPIPVPFTWDGEHIVFISDWFNQEVNMMAMQLNRPADPAKVTNDTGVFTGVGSADALLVNGKGVQQDCFVGSTAPTVAAAANAEKPPDRCNVKQLTMQPGDGSDGGCTHEVFIVEQDKTYNFRIINAATQQYLTVCFENHSVSIMAADVTPVDFVPIDSNCVDINTGQRYDLSITADQPPGLYWISIHEQFSTAAPSTYAIIRYVNANSTTGLPTTPTPQPGVMAPWSQDVLNSVGTSDFILGYNDNYDFEEFWNLFMHGATYDVGVLFPDLVPDKLITFNMTQPLMGNGVMKWAVNNVAHLSQPPCSPLMDQMMADPVYVNEHVAPNTTDMQQQTSNVLLSVHTFNRTGDTPVIYKDIDMNGGVPVKPVAGMHVVQFENGSIVDIVINNLPASAMNGDYRPNVSRVNSMQHPIHMHGHRFWVLGSGDGIYNDTIHRQLLNWRNPILRDTATLPRAGWLYIRFRAGNPGLWPLHCHILWHSYMGQMVFFAEGMDVLKKRPKDQPGPPCPAECLSSFAPFTRSWVANQYNGSRFDLPKK